MAIVGHEESLFTEKYKLEKCVDDLVFTLDRDHDGCRFLINGTLGLSNRICEKAVDHKIPFKMFLPFPVTEYMRIGRSEEGDLIQRYVMNKFCYGLYVHNPDYHETSYQLRNEKMLHEANALFVFWLGRRRGETYWCIKYAMERGIQTFNAYGDKIIQLQKKDV
jgi:hypothetical protein